VFDALYFLARQKHLKEKLDAERTYATGAQLLLKLIEDRKAERAKRNTAPLSE
jgi:phage gp46-like protein